MKTQELNILLICKSLPWRFKGGIQTHTWDLARTLVSKGHSVSILSGGSFRKPELRYICEGVQLIEIPFFPGRYIKPISMLAEELSFNFKVKKWINKNHEQYNVIHAQGRSGYLLYTNKDMYHKLINTVHGLANIESSSKKAFHFNSIVHSKITQYLERKMLANCRFSIAVSHDLKNALMLIANPKNIEVIPNGVKNLASRLTSYSKVEDKFLFIGRLHRLKGLLPLIQIINKVDAQIQLDIVGDGPQRRELAHFIQKNGLTDRVHLLGEKSESEIEQLLPTYRALVLPSFYETQGMVLLEANSLQVPVIASDLTAIRESISHGFNGLLCDPNSPIEFIEAMQYILDHKEEAKKMGIDGQNRVNKDFSWDRITDHTVASYQKLALS
jgi:glycosyltransferase involved in cell wall biosynthesis